MRRGAWPLVGVACAAMMAPVRAAPEAETGLPAECASEKAFGSGVDSVLRAWRAHDKSELAAVYGPIQTALSGRGAVDGAEASEARTSCLVASLERASAEPALGFYAEIMYFNFQMAKVITVHPFEELMHASGSIADRDLAAIDRVYRREELRYGPAIYLDDVVQVVVEEAYASGDGKRIEALRLDATRIGGRVGEGALLGIQRNVEYRERSKRADEESCKRLREAGIKVDNC